MQSTVSEFTQEILAERLGALSSLTRSGIRPLSSSVTGLLVSPYHPRRGLVWAKPGIPWYTQKKLCRNLIAYHVLMQACMHIKKHNLDICSYIQTFVHTYRYELINALKEIKNHSSERQRITQSTRKLNSEAQVCVVFKNRQTHQA